MSSRHHSSGGASSESKLEKEKTRLIQEKCQGMLNEMLRDEDNKYCVDCDAKGPRWASWNLGIFLCIRCAGIHRNLGVHISKVKSVNLDTWTPEQVMTMAQLGNSRARAIYEANLPDTTRRPQTDTALESFIRAKYEHKKYIAKEYIPTPVEKPNWDQEIEEMLKKKKKGTAAGAGEIVLPPSNKFGATHQRAKPTAASTATASTPAAKPSEEVAKQANQGAEANSISTTATGGDLAGDLLGLTLDSVVPTGAAPATGADPFASPAKEGSAASDLFLLESGAASAKLMSKESIMSLYGRGGGGGMGMAPPPQQQQQMGGLGQLGVGVGAVPSASAGVNSLAGLNLNPFLAPAPSAIGFPPQAPAQTYGGGFGVPQQQQVPAAQPQQQFMFNNTGLGALGGSSGLGLTSAQHQFQQFQQSTTPMVNQYTYPVTGAPANPMAIPNPYQAMQMAPGPPTVAPAGGGQFGLGRPAQQNFMFAQSTNTVAPLQSSPPNFLN